MLQLAKIDILKLIEDILIKRYMTLDYQIKPKHVIYLF